MKPIILDSGAVTSLARKSRQAVASIQLTGKKDSWFTVVPSLALFECPSGQQRTDAVVNRFIKRCAVVDGPHERLARRAGVLRAQAGRGSAVDAVVVAIAEPGGAVLTGDTDDLRALAAHAQDVSVFGT